MNVECRTIHEALKDSFAEFTHGFRVVCVRSEMNKDAGEGARRMGGKGEKEEKNFAMGSSPRRERE